eukprot:146018_1
MGSWLTVTNNRQNEVWWVLEENHKGCIYGVTIGLGLALIPAGIFGGAAIGALFATEVVAGEIIATEAIVGGIIGGAWGAGIGGSITAATVQTVENKEKVFREQMIREGREILKYNETYASPKRTLSLLRRITAKRFDRISGKYYEMAFDAWSGATNNSINRYHLGDYPEKEIRTQYLNDAEQVFLEEQTQTDLCIVCHETHPEYAGAMRA